MIGKWIGAIAAIAVLGTSQIANAQRVISPGLTSTDVGKTDEQLQREDDAEKIAINKRAWTQEEADRELQEMWKHAKAVPPTEWSFQAMCDRAIKAGGASLQDRCNMQYRQIDTGNAGKEYEILVTKERTEENGGDSGRHLRVIGKKISPTKLKVTAVAISKSNMNRRDKLDRVLPTKETWLTAQGFCNTSEWGQIWRCDINAQKLNISFEHVPDCPD